MLGAFFSPGGKPGAADLYPPIIKKLTAIRLSDYKQAIIELHMTEMDYPALAALIKKLGEKILKANQDANPNHAPYQEVRRRFLLMLNQFTTDNDEFALVSYAAQLLQYYTILCSEDFHPGEDYTRFDDFLCASIRKHGDTTHNLFIMEYRLIKIYNDLSLWTESITEHPDNNKDSPLSLELLFTHTKRLHHLIQNLVCNTPDNLFYGYLDFVSNYTLAKACELNYRLKSAELSFEEKKRYSDEQKHYLLYAQKAWNDIENKSLGPGKSQRYLKGLEFSFGQHVLFKLPVGHVDAIRHHLKENMISK